MFASSNTCELVLDLASGSGYGSSILRRNNVVESVVSVDIDKAFLLFGKKKYMTLTVVYEQVPHACPLERKNSMWSSL
jgi:protein-L-isoaspartate O-methyltransferase